MFRLLLYFESPPLARIMPPLENHLLPFFGSRVLSTISHSDGHDYVGRRMQPGALAATIRLEYQVLMRLLNRAVLNDMLNKNRLKKVDLPEATKRTRIAQWDELEAIRTVRGDATDQLWRVITVAANTGLRETKVLGIRRSWIGKKTDGYWLALPVARNIKGNPTEIPLNRRAVTVIVSSVVGRPFGALRNIALRVPACKRCSICTFMMSGICWYVAPRPWR